MLGVFVKIIKKIKLKCFFVLIIIISVFYYFNQIIIFYYNTNYEKYPIILWWTPFIAENEKIISCYNNNYNCLLTKNKSYEKNPNLKAYLFYGSNIEPFNLPLPKIDKLWAIFYEESPKNFPLFLYENTQTLFNITATFSRFSHFPLTLQYLENLTVLTDKKYYMNVQEKNKLLSDLAPVLYIQSDCDTPIGRDFYVKELMKYIKIDSYGVCLKNKQFPETISKLYALDLYHEEYLKFISKYKFIISIENSICEDYLTEKLWRPLIVGSIPIYLGSPTVQDWLPSNKSAILVQNFQKMEDLAAFINKTNQNDSLYESYLEHKINGRISNNLLKKALQKGPFGLETDQNHPIPAFECFVCKKLHTSSIELGQFSKLFYNCPKPENSWESHWQVGKCQAKAMDFFIKNKKTVDKEMFEKKWLEYYQQSSC